MHFNALKCIIWHCNFIKKKLAESPPPGFDPHYYISQLRPRMLVLKRWMRGRAGYAWVGSKCTLGLGIALLEWERLLEWDQGVLRCKLRLLEWECDF